MSLYGLLIILRIVFERIIHAQPKNKKKGTDIRFLL